MLQVLAQAQTKADYLVIARAAIAGFGSESYGNNPIIEVLPSMMDERWTSQDFDPSAFLKLEGAPSDWSVNEFSRAVVYRRVYPDGLLAIHYFESSYGPRRQWAVALDSKGAYHKEVACL